MGNWIPVLVRKEHLQQVARVIEHLESEFADDSREFTIESGEMDIATNSPALQSDNLAHRPSWSAEDLERLAKGWTITTKRWGLAMDVCAQSPGKYFPTSEIANRSGMTVVEWRDAPRKISRHLKIHFPDVPKENGNALWPLDAKTQPENPGEVSWAITAEMAQLWLDVRSRSTSA